MLGCCAPWQCPSSQPFPSRPFSEADPLLLLPRGLKTHLLVLHEDVGEALTLIPCPRSVHWRQNTFLLED